MTVVDVGVWVGGEVIEWLLETCMSVRLTGWNYFLRVSVRRPKCDRSSQLVTVREKTEKKHSKTDKQITTTDNESSEKACGMPVA